MESQITSIVFWRVDANKQPIGKRYSVPIERFNLRQLLRILQPRNGFIVLAETSDGGILFSVRLIKILYWFASQYYSDYAKYCEVYNVFRLWRVKFGHKTHLSDSEIADIEDYNAGELAQIIALYSSELD